VSAANCHGFRKTTLWVPLLASRCLAENVAHICIITIFECVDSGLETQMSREGFIIIPPATPE
jgi:hypothetical protein